MASKLNKFLSVYLIMHFFLFPTEAMSMSHFEMKINGPENRIFEKNEYLSKNFLLKQTKISSKKKVLGET